LDIRIARHGLPLERSDAHPALRALGAGDPPVSVLVLKELRSVALNLRDRLPVFEIQRGVGIENETPVLVGETFLAEFRIPAAPDQIKPSVER
jgi:hypothetical protein